MPGMRSAREVSHLNSAKRRSKKSCAWNYYLHGIGGSTRPSPQPRLDEQVSHVLIRMTGAVGHDSYGRGGCRVAKLWVEDVVQSLQQRLVTFRIVYHVS